LARGPEQLAGERRKIRGATVLEITEARERTEFTHHRGSRVSRDNNSLP
jgi:hypothetical protein